MKLDIKVEGKSRFFLDKALEMAQAASESLRNNFRKDPPRQRGTVKEVKIVYDTISDTIIKNFIEKEFPDHSYVTEETGFVDKRSDYLWIVDPLDGTSNFASHNPLFSVSISLWERGVPLLGIIEAPIMQERFVAIKNKGSYIVDFLRRCVRKASVSDVRENAKAYGVYCEGGTKNKESSLRVLKKYYLQFRDVRKLGSAAIELAFVGSGRVESYMTTEISIWDIAAGILFVKEAGGELYHFDGKAYRWDEFRIEQRFNMLATNGKIAVDLRL